MATPRFTPLHVHSHYSLLEGVDSLDALLARAVACGYQDLALTDSNNLYGAVAFVEAARKHGVRPILGACLRHEGERCTALIGEEAGYQSLCRILSRLHLGAGSGDPRTIDGDPRSQVRGRETRAQQGGDRATREDVGTTSDGPRTTSSLTDLLVENANGLHVLIDEQLCAGSGDPRTARGMSGDPRTARGMSGDPRTARGMSGDPRTAQGSGDPRTAQGDPRTARGDARTAQGDSRIARLREAFGDRLWLEVIRPPRSAARERALLEAGQRLGLRPIASVAAHFATPEGYPTFRLLTAVRQGILLDQVPARLPITPAHHLPEIEEVYQRFRDLPEAIVNTAHLAEQCRSDVLPRGIVLPSPRVPHAHDAFSYLQLLCERGLRRRRVSGEGLVVSGNESAPRVARPERREGRDEASMVSTPVEDFGCTIQSAIQHSALTTEHRELTLPGSPISTGHRGLTPSGSPTTTEHRRLMPPGSPARQRLEEELHIIRQRGLAGYFLVVRQIAREARRRRFSMALRGSAGNSLICYLLGITDVDPLRFGLPLERFLHAGRPDLPDIDLDFDWRERDEIIASVFERYGSAHTAMISSHLFLQPRSAFREAAKVHGLSNEQTSQLIETLLQRVEGFFEEDKETGRQGDTETRRRGDAETRSKNDTETRGRGDQKQERHGDTGTRRRGDQKQERRGDTGNERQGDKETGRQGDNGDLRVSVSPRLRVDLPQGNERQGDKETGRQGDNGDLRVSVSPRLRVDLSPRLRVDLPPPPGFPLEPERWPRLLADARRLLGRPRHLSVHPGGIVITPGPIENYVPLQRAAKGVVITQFEKDAVEQIGLVKIDLLGNRALSTVSEACRRLDPVSRESVSRSPERLDEATLKLLQQGDTIGVNQLESPAMRHLLIQMRPRSMHDVIQALALIRPGAASIGAKEKFIRRRRGLEPVQHLHPSLEPLLGDSCGLMLYEDDALRVVQILTGLSAPEADRFRKQITKSVAGAEVEALSKAFLAACTRNGIARPVAEEIWVNLAKFNSYSFCRSHAVSYGMIAWQASYLKAHFPRVFWTAALNNNQGMYPRRVYVEAAKRGGIPFFLPCVNRSESEFSIEAVSGGVVSGEWSQAMSYYSPLTDSPLTPSTGIRTGLSCIRSLDEASREVILEDRRRRGPYQSLTDFLERVTVGPETLALLIQVGAFDFTGQSRSALMLTATIEERMPRHASFFSMTDLRAPTVREGSSSPYDWTPADYSQVRQWREEWERLGFLAGPPLMVLFRPLLPKELQDSRDCRVGRPIRLAGLVATGRHTETKNGEEMQFISIEDEWGLVEVTLFPRLCPPVPHLGVGPYIVEGEVDEQYGVLTVTARRFYQALASGPESRER